MGMANFTSPLSSYLILYSCSFYHYSCRCYIAPESEVLQRKASQ